MIESQLVISFLNAVLLGTTAFEAQRFTAEPVNVTVPLGSRIVLPCIVINKSEALQWTKDGFGLGFQRNLPSHDRYKMIGCDREGDFSLEINPVTLEDEAEYQCVVIPGPKGQPGIKSRPATVTVLNHPQPPRILQGKSLIVVEDAEILLECISMPERVAPKITWIDDQGNVLNKNVNCLVKPYLNGRRFMTNSSLRLVPKKNHNNSTLTCRAESASDGNYRESKLTLYVNYPPKLNLSILSGMETSGWIREGNDIELLCQADGNPPEITYKWFLDDKLITGNSTKNLLIEKVTRKFHGSLINCKAYNSVGESRAYEILEVSIDGLRSLSKQKRFEMDRGSTVTFFCDVGNDPAQNISWIHKNTRKIVGTSSHMTLVVDQKSEGTYYCESLTGGFHRIGAEIHIFVKGRPIIISNNVQFGTVGEDAFLECIVIPFSHSTNISWTFKGAPIDSTSQGYYILEDVLQNRIKSILTIEKAESQNFDRYSCSAINLHGHDSTEIFLKPQRTSLLPIIITAFLVAIIIIGIALLIIFCPNHFKMRPTSLISRKNLCWEVPNHSFNEIDENFESRKHPIATRFCGEIDQGYDNRKEMGGESLIKGESDDGLQGCPREFFEPALPSQDGGVLMKRLTDINLSLAENMSNSSSTDCEENSTLSTVLSEFDQIDVTPYVICSYRRGSNTSLVASTGSDESTDYISATESIKNIEDFGKVVPATQ